jgi:MSHA biogenesis protein MshK
VFRLGLQIVIVAGLGLMPVADAQQSLPDPTERTSMGGTRDTSTGVTRWVLESTLVSADRRIAVINGESLMVGDRIGGARVTRIEPFSVRLRTAEGTIELNLTDSDPKTVAGGGNG